MLREYWHCAGMNLDYNKYSAGRAIYYNGHLNLIATVDKTDVSMVANTPELQDPDLFVHIGEVADADGAQQGMFTQPIQGKRTSDSIRVTGFDISIKALFRAVAVLEADHQLIGDMGPTEVPPAQPPNVPRRIETVILKYAIVGTLRDQNIDLEAFADPVVRELLPFNTWGYNRLLDPYESTFEGWIKKRTFINGQLKVALSSTRDKDLTVFRSIKLKNPLVIKYDPTDQNGTRTYDWAFYLVLRSNIPVTDATQTDDFSAYAPQVSVCTKLHYFE